jgi:hypothetical protein
MRTFSPVRARARRGQVRREARTDATSTLPIRNENGGPTMAVDARRDAIARALSDGGGVLRLRPAWVARDFLPPGRRLGLPEDAYDLGERGAICERWLASTTKADNRVGPPDEGLSYLALEGEEVTLRDAVESDPGSIMGSEYATTHDGLGRLAKIFDYGARLPFHLHQRQEHAALVGRHSKDEAYYFPPGVVMGAHPESFLGLHPSVAEQANHEVLLPFLEDWDSDLILQHSVAYLQVAEEGFHIPSGVLHGPGTALTIELQEDSDVFAMLQALNAGTIISKELLWKDVRGEDRETKGERFILELIDWETNGDPYFFENRHLSPQLVDGSRTEAGEEHWVYYNTTKFNGKKLVVRPGCSYRSVDRGVYNVLVWSGAGTYGGMPVEGGNPELDEVLVTHDRAVQGVEVRNTGTEDLVAIKFFGPDVNPDVPMIGRR